MWPDPLGGALFFSEVVGKIGVGCTCFRKNILVGEYNGGIFGNFGLGWVGLVAKSWKIYWFWEKSSPTDVFGYVCRKIVGI